MKQKDVAIIIVVAFVSGIGSFLISNKLFVSPDNRKQKAEVVDSIDASFQTPSKTYFNSSSIDPTQTSALGDSSNSDPFKPGANGR
ncbi:MAG TPA: hypothetical protein VLF59_03410 [Candidatus Saccharimonadales bacterium]|nr:hypothetical protein [Candidatus Saccharimonadales bacterium]